MSKRKEIDQDSYGEDDTVTRGEGNMEEEVEEEEVLVDDDEYEEEEIEEAVVDDEDEYVEEDAEEEVNVPYLRKNNSSLGDGDDEDYNIENNGDNSIPENEYDPVVSSSNDGKKLRIMSSASQSQLYQSQLSLADGDDADAAASEDMVTSNGQFTSSIPLEPTASAAGAGASGTLVPPLPMKKPLSMWFRYFGEMKKKYQVEHPEMHFTEVAKIVAESYKSMPEEEKDKLKAACDADKAEYDRYMQENGLSAIGNNSNSNSNKEYDILRDIIIPQARVRRTMKMDPEVKSVSKEGVVASTKTAELFLSYLASQALRSAKSNRGANVKTLKMSDLVNAIHSNSTLDFLRMDFPRGYGAPPPPTTSSANASDDKPATVSTKAGGKKTQPPPIVDSSNKSITSFFAKK